MAIKSKSGTGRMLFKVALLSGVAMLASACSYDLMGPDGSNIAEWEKPFVANENPAEDAYATGKNHYKKGLYGLALKSFHTALGHRPNSVESLNAVAATYDKLGRFDLSRRYYARALALDPESPQTLNNIGYSFVMQNDFRSARAYFDRARAAGGSVSTQGAVGANLSALNSAEGRHETTTQLAGIPVEASVAAPLNASVTTSKAMHRNTPVAKNTEMVQSVSVVEIKPGVIAEEAREVAIVAVAPAKIRNTRMAQRPVVAHAAAPEAAPVGVVEIEIGVVEAEARVVEVEQETLVASKPALKQKLLTKDPAPADQPEVLAKLAVPVALSTPVARSEKMSRPTTQSTPVANKSEPVIEVSNGAGRRFLAAHIRDFLGTKGVDTVRLTNADNFSYQKTAVFYREGFRTRAHAITHMLPMPVAMYRVEDQKSDILIRLGADSLEFDDRMQTLRSAGT